MSSKDTLEKVYQQHISLQKIYDPAKEKAKRNKDFEIKIIPPSRQTKKNHRKSRIIDDYFDQLDEDITELYILKIITIFENIVIDRIDNASGIIQGTIKTKYNQRNSEPVPLSRSVTSLIKTKEDIFSLSKAKDILEKQLSKDLLNDLKEIIEHRNWLAHGKRYNVGKESTLTIEEIKNILMDIVDEIG